MYSASFLAVSGLIALAAATPLQHQPHHQHHKRDYVWVTETVEDIVTIPVTETVWLEPGQTPPAQASASVSSASAAPVYTAASSSEEVSSAYVPSTSTTSTSASVAPAAPSTSTTSTSASVAPAAPSSSSTSQYVAPTPSSSSSTSEYVAPSSTWVSSTTSSSSTSASTSATSNGITSGPAVAGTSYTGDLTWYDTGLGACGWTSTASDSIVAVSEVVFDAYGTANPNDNPLCGLTVTITGVDGSPYTATVVDRCTACAEGDLDLSEDFFNTVTDYGNGRVPGITWEWN